MDNQTKYVMALGAFRQQVAILRAAGREVQAAAFALGSAPDVPITEAVVAECERELRALCSTSAGMRQLFHLASNGGNL